jgi:hypothetical protein
MANGKRHAARGMPLHYSLIAPPGGSTHRLPCLATAEPRELGEEPARKGIGHLQEM